MTQMNIGYQLAKIKLNNALRTFNDDGDMVGANIRAVQTIVKCTTNHPGLFYDYKIGNYNNIFEFLSKYANYIDWHKHINYERINIPDKFILKYRSRLDMSQVIEFQTMSVVLCSKFVQAKYIPNFMRNKKISDSTKIDVLRWIGLQKALIWKYFPDAKFHPDDVQVWHHTAIRTTEHTKYTEQIQEVLDEHYGKPIKISGSFTVRGIPNKVFIMHDDNTSSDMIDLSTWQITENCLPDKIFEEAMSRI